MFVHVDADDDFLGHDDDLFGHHDVFFCAATCSCILMLMQFNVFFHDDANLQQVRAC